MCITVVTVPSKSAFSLRARQRVLHIHEPTNQSVLSKFLYYDTLIGWLMNMKYALTRVKAR